jgi:hypothetical protein
VGASTPRRLPPADVSGDWPGHDPPGSQYTFEGYLRGLRRFVLGRRQATGWRRVLATVLAWLVLGPLLLGVVVALVNVVQDLAR